MTIVSSKEDNPLRKQLELSPIERLYEAGWLVHFLKESMRMTKGLLDLPDWLPYEVQLEYGSGTQLSEEGREV